MLDQIRLPREFFDKLLHLDAEITARVAAERCPRCGGPVHRGDYDRKPRGAAIAAAGEAFTRRFSLCCGREGCRKRAMPPSVRFLGRRVYLGAVVIVAAIVARAISVTKQIRRATGVPSRTVRRWLAWWGGPFAATPVFIALAARIPALARHELPDAVVARLPGDADERIRRLLLWLAPLTTASLPDGARFLRGLG